MHAQQERKVILVLHIFAIFITGLHAIIVTASLFRWQSIYWYVTDKLLRLPVCVYITCLFTVWHSVLQCQTELGPEVLLGQFVKYMYDLGRIRLLESRFG